MTARLDKPTILTNYFKNGDIPDQYAFAKFLYTSLTPQISDLGSVSGTVMVDASTGDLFRMTLTGATVLALPSNPVDGQELLFWIKQDGSGGHTLDISAFVIISSITLPLPFNTAIGATNMLLVRYDGANARWLIIQNSVNTGDETLATIKDKLGAANVSADGYLTSADWNTFSSGGGGVPYTGATGNVNLGVHSLITSSNVSSNVFIVKTSTVTDAATLVATDATQGGIFRITLTESVTLSNPTGCVDGQSLTWLIRQGGTGSNGITLDTKFLIPTSGTNPLAWSTTVGYTDMFVVRYSSVDDLFLVVACVPGYLTP